MSVLDLASLWKLTLEFEGYQIQEFSGAYDLGRSKLILRKIPLIARDHEIHLCRQGTGHELVILGVGRNTGKRGRIQKITLAVKQVDEGRDFVWGKSKLSRARTSEYPCSTAGEKQGLMRPCLTARSSKASLPEGEIMADTRTFVSMTDRITFSSHACTP
jgi:hypothetical protein